MGKMLGVLDHETLIQVQVGGIVGLCASLV